MNQEKIKKIAEILKEDLGQTKALLELSPSEAAEYFTNKGCDVTEQEMIELAEGIKKMAAHLNEDGELDEAALEEVAGGASVEATLYGTLGVTLVAAAATYGWSVATLVGLGAAVVCSW